MGKLTERDKKAWRLGFRAAVQGLAARVTQAFDFNLARIQAGMNGERSPYDPPDEWPPEPPARKGVR